MNKLTHKLEQLIRAREQLQKAADYYKKENDITKKEFLRDSIIQRFEFTFELAWKAIREYELLQGIRLDTPREVLKRAYKIGVIGNETGWLMLLQDRNNTSHIYDENIAIEICARVEGTYLPMFENLIDKLRSYGADTQ